MTAGASRGDAGDPRIRSTARSSAASPPTASSTTGRCARSIDRGPLLDRRGARRRISSIISATARSDRRPARGGRRQHRLLSLTRYLDAAGRPHQSGPTIALIYATGLIARGGGAAARSASNGMLGADTVIDAFRQARARSRGARHPVPHRQPRRLGGRVGVDLARGGAGQGGGQAGHRQHGRCRGLGRLLHRRRRRQDRRRAGDPHRLHRRASPARC